jgi:hypothetical protein
VRVYQFRHIRAEGKSSPDAGERMLRRTTMRLLLAMAVGFVVSATAAGQPTSRKTPNLLVSLPSLGSVTWRCGTTDGIYALGYREFWASATTRVTLRAGQKSFVRRVDPRQLVLFPYLRSRFQRLTFVQRTEPGTLRAVVSVDFGAASRAYPPCQQYLPPRFVVNVYPRPNGR